MPGDTDVGLQSTGPHSHDDNPNDFTRLHITPFDTELLNIVLSASILPKARNISFHTVATFPENRYGFVDLPTQDAEKLKGKLNGSVLKGTKMRIETAVPESRIEPSGNESREEKKKSKKKSKDKDEGSKKRKRDDNVVEGVLLSDRKVKRGWTEAPVDYKQKKKEKKKEKGEKGTKDKSQRIKSKYTDQEECLLKVRLPPSAMKNLPEDDQTARKKKKKRGKEREVTIHEFEKTTRFPSFLKDGGSASARPGATDFVEGKGWVDEDGNVVEPVKSKRPTVTSLKKADAKDAPVEEDSDDTSSSGTSSDEEPEKDESPLKKKSSLANDSDDSDTSSSGSDDDADGDMEGSADQATPVSAVSARPVSSSSSRSLRIKIPPPNTPSSSTTVHPLEALYKRKNPEGDATQTPPKIQEPFTFFGAGEDEEAEEERGSGRKMPPMPMTPFTRQDLEWRNVRSAAPTPDTAHPLRMQNMWPSSRDDDEDMDDDADSVAAEDQEEEEDDEDEADNQGSTTNGNKANSSNFQSWFWENRRDLNQSWMKRRKAAAKEKRHRENKARASKAV